MTNFIFGTSDISKMTHTMSIRAFIFWQRVLSGSLGKNSIMNKKGLEKNPTRPTREMIVNCVVIMLMYINCSGILINL